MTVTNIRKLRKQEIGIGYVKESKDKKGSNQRQKIRISFAKQWLTVCNQTQITVIIRSND